MKKSLIYLYEDYRFFLSSLCLMALADGRFDLHLLLLVRSLTDANRLFFTFVSKTGCLKIIRPVDPCTLSAKLNSLWLYLYSVSGEFSTFVCRIIFFSFMCHVTR
jgi:hypothetical protein